MLISVRGWHDHEALCLGQRLTTSKLRPRTKLEIVFHELNFLITMKNIFIRLSTTQDEPKRIF